jgi:hypothetical protein
MIAGPLTSLVQRTLTVTNGNSTPVAFKVKTTAPKVCDDLRWLVSLLIGDPALLRPAQLGSDRTWRVGGGAGYVSTGV